MSPQSPSELLIGTRSAGKFCEICLLLARLPPRLLSLNDFPGTLAAEETGATFADNASIKARAYAAQTKRWTLADDSGLEVDALGGAPGVFSARYAGEQATDAERVALLLRKLSAFSGAQRGARFVSVIAIADPQARVIQTVCGTSVGRIARQAKGTNGFGYDPVFIPQGYEQSFGELPDEIKQRISHRALALEAARAFLTNLFGNQI